MWLGLPGGTGDRNTNLAEQTRRRPRSGPPHTPLRHYELGLKVFTALLGLAFRSEVAQRKVAVSDMYMS